MLLTLHSGPLSPNTLTVPPIFGVLFGAGAKLAWADVCSRTAAWAGRRSFFETSRKVACTACHTRTVDLGPKKKRKKKCRVVSGGTWWCRLRIRRVFDMGIDLFGCRDAGTSCFAFEASEKKPKGT